MPPTLLDILLQSFADLRAVGGRGRQRRREAGVGAVHRRADRRAGGRHPAQQVLRRRARCAPRRWPARWSARWPGASPRTWPSSTSTCTASSSRAAKDERRAWPEFLEGGRAGDRHPVMSGPSRRGPSSALREQLQRGRRRRSPAAPTPWRASSPASSTTSTGRCASRWRSSRSATTRPPRRWRWCAGCARSSRRSIYLELCEDMRRCWPSCATAGCRWRCRRSRPRSTASPPSGRRCRWSRRSPRPRPSTRPSPTRWTRRASSWCWSTAPPTTSSSGSARDGPPGRREADAERRRGGRRTHRRPRRRPRCTATRSAWRSATCGRASPNWRNTCCTTAGCGTGRSGGTSTSNCRSATPTTTPTARSWS